MDSSIAAAISISALTFIDGLILVGLIINGWGAFAACVYAYSHGYLSITTIMIVSFVGVFLAEQLSFVIARFFGDGVISMGASFFAFTRKRREHSRLRVLWPKLTPEGWHAGIAIISTNVSRWGGWYIIVGRWTPVASLVPAASAILGMPYRNFVIFSAIGCALWSTVWNVIVYAAVKGYVSLMI